MKNIGILIYDDTLIGGAERAAINLSAELSVDYNIHIISIFARNKIKLDLQSKLYKHFVVCDKTKSLSLNAISISNKLKKYLIQNKIDILIMVTAGVNFIGILATFNLNTKTVYCEHSNLLNKTYGKKHVLRQYIGAKFADKIITLTETDLLNFKKIFKIDSNKVCCIPNFFNHSKCDDLVYNVESKKIITVGRLEKVKGYDNLLKVACLLKNNGFIWDIYGDGKEKDNILNEIKIHGLDDFIFLKGNVNNLSKLFNDYAIFVLTSYYEGFPLVLLEAQNAKLPLVSFNCPTGPSEMIIDNINGFLVDNYDINEMANKIKLLMDDKDLRLKFSNNSLLNFDKFSKKKVIAQWQKLIESL